MTKGLELAFDKRTEAFPLKITGTGKIAKKSFWLNLGVKYV